MAESEKENPMSDEQRAFAEKLFSDNYKILSKRVFELVREVDPDSAEDCLSRLFLTLCLSIDKVMEHKNPTAWLFLTARYICLKHIRSVGIRTKKTVPLEDSLNTFSLSEDSPEERIIDDILWTQWKNENMRERLIHGLNRNEREIFRLRFEEGMTNAEIGDKLGKSEDAVRFTVYYIKKKITERIYSHDF